MKRHQASLVLSALVLIGATATGAGIALATPAPDPNTVTLPNGIRGTVVPAPPINETTATTEPQLAGITGGGPLTEEAALTFLTRDTAEFPSLTVTHVITTTLGRIQSQNETIPNGYTADQKVIVATGIGEYVPSFGVIEQHLTWGALVFDADTGALLSSFSAPGDVPAFLVS